MLAPLRLVAVAFLVGLLGAHPSDAKPAACGGGRYLLSGSALSGAPAAPSSSVVTIASTGVVIPDVCPEIRPKTLRGNRAGVTKLKVVWPSCEGFTGRVKLTAKLTESCNRLEGKVKAKKFKRPVTALLSRCGDAILDRDGGELCEPPGTDICTAACEPNFTDISLTNASVAPLSGLPVTLNGMLVLAPDSDLSGEIAVTYGSGGSATILATSDGTFSVHVGGTVLDLLADYGESVAVDGIPTRVEDALEAFATDAGSGLDPSQWTPVGQATLALLGLVNTPEFKANAEIARTLGNISPAVASSRRQIMPLSEDPGELLYRASIFCKASVYSASAAVLTILAGGCIGLTAACVGAAVTNVLTLGPIAIACAPLYVICTGGGVLTTDKVYDIVAEEWKRSPCEGGEESVYPYCSSRGTCSAGRCGVVEEPFGGNRCRCVASDACGSSAPACGGKCPGGQTCQHFDFAPGFSEHVPRHGYCLCKGAITVTINAPGGGTVYTDSVTVIGSVLDAQPGTSVEISVNGTVQATAAVDGSGGFSANVPLEKRYTAADLTLSSPSLHVQTCGAQSVPATLTPSKGQDEVRNVIGAKVVGDDAAPTTVSVTHGVLVSRFEVTWNTCPPLNKNEGRSVGIGDVSLEVGTVDCGVQPPGGFTATCSVTTSVDTSVGTLSVESTWSFDVPTPCP